jgi:hypothetical protein
MTRFTTSNPFELAMPTSEIPHATTRAWSGVHLTVCRLVTSASLLALSVACTGEIDGSAPGGSPMGSGGSDVTGAAGTPGTPGTAGSGGAGVAPEKANTVLRRLNKSEYNNTVRDLLGTSLHPAGVATNPDDGLKDYVSAGFDTNGESLSLSLQHLEILEQAATQLVDELFALPVGDARRSAVLTCQLQAGAEETCARQILSSFARRAFRRPVIDADISGLLQVARKVSDAGDGYEEGLKAALRAVLLSPHFLFLVEKPMAAAPGALAPLRDHELAARLSYFLWSSMPDAALSALADAGTLAKDSAKLLAEVERMLADGKAAALAENFAGQWLTLRRAAVVEPDPLTFSGYDVALRDSAVRETELFFSELVSGNAPIATLLSADFTFANQRLGQHYGTPVAGAEFQRVSLTGTPRVGVLGQVSFLIGNSHPAFTSPTKRGVWVLEQLLCDEPPAPPPDIPPLEKPVQGQTVREKLAEHRANPSCAACHKYFDPIGLGLENFDALGGYREMESGRPVDASGNLLTPDAQGELQETSFAGLRELATLLSQDARLQGCFAEQLLTYAVGRSFRGASGHHYAEGLVQSAQGAAQPGVRDLLKAVVLSDAFRNRRGE